MADTLYQYYRAFGWLVVRANRPDGSVTPVTVEADSQRSESSARTLYTQGELLNRCLTDDLPVVGRKPGVYSLDLNPIRAGKYELTAKGDVVWWCIDKANNGGQLPDLAPIIMSPGESKQFAAGARILLCEGSVYRGEEVLSGPKTITLAENTTLLAGALVYGFHFL